MLQRHIYYVNFGINIGTEINATRPSIIMKDWDYWFWEDIIVIPLTSITPEKSKDTFDIPVPTIAAEWLRNDSYAKIRQMRCVSKKRIEMYVWKVVDDTIKQQITEAIKKMLKLK